MTRAMKDSGIQWIGQIPEGWEVKRLKALFTFGKGLPITKENLVEIGIPVISYGQIHSKTNSGVRLQDDLVRYVPDTYLKSNPDSLVHKGDYIFADTSEDLEGCGNCVFADKEKMLFAGYHTIIFKNKGTSNNNYLAYLFKTDSWRNQIRSKCFGVKLFSITRKILASANIILPPLEEQNCIAAFLDEKCAAIDNVLEKTKASIEEYKKLKQSVITQAVTKGIRPNRPMKDSGIEWIGQIPEDWDTKVVFQIFRQVKNKNTGMTEQNLMSLSYGKIKRKNIETTFGLLPESFEGYNIIEKDDIVLRLTDLQNDHTSLRTGISREKGIITSAYLTIRNYSDNSTEYLHYYLHAFDICKGFYGMGAGVRQGLNWEEMKKLKILVPPLAEQQAIADYLDTKCTEIDNLIAKKEQFLKEIETYKKSLIYEYVTGKKEVL